MGRDSIIRNMWYLNVNSISGTAIGKCGSQGSNLTDLDITAGFITASQQLSKEMVKSDEVSKYSWEDIKGGAKRLTLYTTWGNDICNGLHDKPVPVITSMLQVSGPQFENDYQYNDLLRFLRDINDEIVYRFMLGELTMERVIDPIINIDILNNSLKDFGFSKKGRLIGEKNHKLNRIINQTLNMILKNDLRVLEAILSKIPLESTCMQEEYGKRVSEFKKYIKKQVHEFLEDEKRLTQIRAIKIYGKSNSYKELRNDYNKFLDKQESYFQKKRGLIVALENCYSSLEEIPEKLFSIKKNSEFEKIKIIKKLLPSTVKLNEYIKSVREDILKTEESSELVELEKNIHFNEAEILKPFIEEGLLSENQAKELYPELTKLKSNLETFVSILKELGNRDVEQELDNFRGTYTYINQEIMNYGEKSNNIEQIQKLNELIHQETGIDPNSVDKSKEEEYIIQDFRKVVRETINRQRKNLITKIVNALYEHIFNSYNKFKHVIVFPNDIKILIIERIIYHLNLFVNRIQDYSFAALLVKALRRITPKSLVKSYSIGLLRSYLENYLYDNYVQNPLLISDKNLYIALDSYSLEFCSEIIKDTGLNTNLYNEIESLSLPNSYKESFIQILDSFGLTRDNVARELQNSRELFENWIEKINGLVKELNVPSQNITVQEFLDYCEKLLKTKSKNKELKSKRNFFIKEIILKNSNPNSEERVHLLDAYKRKLELNRITNEIENLGAAKEKYFTKSEYQDLLSISKTLLRNSLERDKDTIQQILKSTKSLVDNQETKKLNQLLNKITNARELLKDNEKLKAIEERIKGIVKFRDLIDIFELLDSLENEFLSLSGYAHIKGIVKTIIRDEPLIKESSIQNKHKSYDLLLEALVDTYAAIYEDNFGSFSFKGNGKIDIKKSEIEIRPGSLFETQYKKAREQLELFYGFKAFDYLFKTIKEYESKFKYFNMEFLMNYLVEYMEKEGVNDSFRFVRSFVELDKIRKFFKFLIDKFSKNEVIKNLQFKIDTLYNKTSGYLMGNIGNKPNFPYDLRIFKFEELKTIDIILENVTPKEKKYFLDTKHSDKNHISRDYNLKKLSDKKINSLIEEIDDLADLIENDVSYLEKKFSFEPPQIPSLKRIIKRVSEDLRGAIRRESEKYNLNEINFENVNRIRIMSLLDSTIYEVPLDIKMNLVKQGRYNKSSIKSIIKSSTRISDLLRISMNAALSKDEIFRKILSTELMYTDKNIPYLEIEMAMPSEITYNHLDRIFGKNLIWTDERTLLKGYKPPFDNLDKKTLGEALRASIHKELFKELNPVFSLLNKYSREMHTGFDKIYEKLFN
ncbi:MAG: hypothetical protein GF353_11750 [Candidatus Lokiarchaeota archaeon]|nr:hypothetical protein [Candidatus Lokiarchaeota archaeon]